MEPGCNMKEMQPEALGKRPTQARGPGDARCPPVWPAALGQALHPRIKVGLKEAGDGVALLQTMMVQRGLLGG